MKTRKLSDLYTIVLNRIKNGDSFFICNSVKALLRRNLITEKEHDKLVEHFLKQLPTQSKNAKFINENFNHNAKPSQGWWINEYRSKEGYQIRIDFLEHLIKKTSKKLVISE